MKLTLIAASMLIASAAMAAPAAQWVTVDAEIFAKLQTKLGKSYKSVQRGNGAVAMKLTPKEVELLSETIHDELHRCGGFMGHESYEEAIQAISFQGETEFAKHAKFDDYSINNQSIVKPMVAQVNELSIRQMIEKLTSFHTRHYKSETGVKSSEFIRDTWADLSKHRSDVTVELVKHKNWPQASIVMTIEGSESPDEIVIIGGHADSIVSGMFGGGSPTARSPGADDNASGIATITEAIRIAMENNFKPKKTIQFMGYAAEEVGLLGSKDIATAYKKEAKRVVGVIQFDMTLNKGTKDMDIVMMSDFTNKAQNEFLGRLIDEYVKVPWGYSKCGYGCSDHASWTSNGYPASMPFESTMGDINSKIHTVNDTLATAGGDAKHSAKFAKLALAFIAELGN